MKQFCCKTFLFGFPFVRKLSRERGLIREDDGTRQRLREMICNIAKVMSGEVR
jgi:hypothetical protein